jgi:hypothetical protein
MIRRALGLALLLTATQAFAAGRIVIINFDPAGTGLNDPAPAAPQPGNPATTLGEQRMNVFRAAAERWQNALDLHVDIRVAANFMGIAGCTATDGVLGQATAIRWIDDFPGAPRGGVWYPSALANQFAHTDLLPDTDDIYMQFNALVDNRTCLGDANWYYGLDGQHGKDVDLYLVALHELAHGLGLTGAATAPAFRDDLPSVFDLHTLDVATGLRWDQLTPEQRSTSIVATGKLAWDGDNVRTYASRFLQWRTTLTVTAPADVAHDYDIGTSSFGAPANRAAVAGTIVPALDAQNADGPLATDGCSAFANAAEIAGNIALVDRGTCPFTTKATNAQAAGATALIVVDNKRDTCTPPSLSALGDSGAAIRIPVISLAPTDADALRAQLAAHANVTAMLRVDPTQLAGTTRDGNVRLYAPCSLQPTSSVHHWDTAASPNLLMEPSINTDLLHGLDLTLYQLLDLGWSVPPRTGRTFLRH